MSKRQSDYLSALLAETPAPAPAPADFPIREAAPRIPAPPPASEAPPSPAPKPGMTLLARESALARVAAGEVKQVTQLLLDPARVRIWAGNPRHQASLNEDNCRDLIDAILAENGQKVPAIVRRVTDDPDIDYEVIAGSRRHWAISWLRANNYPDMMFLAQVHALDDEAAFRISDIENRARKDVSDFERARIYLQALDEHYGGKQARMAERLRLSKGWLSKMLSVAALPDWCVAAFASPADIQLKTCYPLAQRVHGAKDDAELLKALKSEARQLQSEQKTAPVPAAEAIHRLMAAGVEDGAREALVTLDKGGRAALSIVSANRNGVSVRLHAGSGASAQELAHMLQDALEALERNGQRLRF
jgi:ParB family chromosome partitioning protein